MVDLGVVVDEFKSQPLRSPTLAGDKGTYYRGIIQGYIPLLPTNPHSVASKDSSFKQVSALTQQTCFNPHCGMLGIFGNKWGRGVLILGGGDYTITCKLFEIMNCIRE